MARLDSRVPKLEGGSLSDTDDDLDEKVGGRRVLVLPIVLSLLTT